METDEVLRATEQPGDGTPHGPGGVTPAQPPSVESPQGTYSPSKPYDSQPVSPAPDDDDGEAGIRNPEPPPELTESAELLRADNIGNTVFSKHWVFTTLMKLIKEVEREDENKDGDSVHDVAEELQDELCKLWDMAMNKDVAVFLSEFQAVEILTGVIAKSRAPRLTEIAVGILGNMACCSSVCSTITSSSRVRELVLLLMETPGDAPTLVEVTRLLCVCISREGAECPLVAAIRQSDSVLQNVMFVFNSSTNTDLLKNMAEFVDKLLETEEEMCTLWATVDFIQAIHEAIKQIGERPGEIVGTYFHICQLLSTTEAGVKALVSEVDNVGSSLLLYLEHVCEEEIIAIVGSENTMASALSTLNALYMSSGANSVVRDQEKKLTRNLLKILDALYDIMDTDTQSDLTNTDSNRTSPWSKQDNVSNEATSDTPKNTSRSASNVNVNNVNGNEPTLNNTNQANGPESNKFDSVNKQACSVHSERTGGHTAGTAGFRTDFREERTLLYHTLHSFLIDLVQAIPLEKSELPDMLDYLERYCPNDRLHALLRALRHPTTPNHILALKQHAALYECQHLLQKIDQWLEAT